MTTANAADTFSRSMRALNSMALADLPPELDQDARDIARIILDHGKDYVGTEYCDMTAPLLESLARLVQAAKAADRLAKLEESNTLLSASLKKQDAQIERLAQDNARLLGLLAAAQAEARNWKRIAEDALSQPAEQAPLMIRCQVCEHHTPIVFEPEPARREGE